MKSRKLAEALNYAFAGFAIGYFFAAIALSIAWGRIP